MTAKRSKPSAYARLAQSIRRVSYRYADIRRVRAMIDRSARDGAITMSQEDRLVALLNRIIAAKRGSHGRYSR